MLKEPGARLDGFHGDYPPSRLRGELRLAESQCNATRERALGRVAAGAGRGRWGVGEGPEGAARRYPVVASVRHRIGGAQGSGTGGETGWK